MTAPARREFYKGTPFRFRLRNEFPGRAGKLMRLAKDNRVVRVGKGWDEAALGDLRTYTDALRRDGISVPHYDVLRAPHFDNMSAQATYVVTESIAGERLDEIARPTEIDWQLAVPRAFYEAFYQALDCFVAALIGHYWTILERGGLVFQAMDESQFIYGTTRANHRPQIYFVDLDSTYSRVQPLSTCEPGSTGAIRSDFEKPLNILFEMLLQHPRASLPSCKEAARDYIAFCHACFPDFYGPNRPRWAKALHFERYQKLKGLLFSE